MRGWLSSIIAVASLVSPAVAADMPVKAGPAPAAAYIWGGFYAGINAGYGWNDSRPIELFTDDVTPLNFGDATTPSRGTIGDIALKGPFFGGQAGYNHLWGAFLLGVEVDFQYSGMRNQLAGTFTNPNGTFPIVGNANLDIGWFGTVRGRLGVTRDNWLVYVTGGWAFGQVDAKLHAFEVGGGALFEGRLSSRTRSGFAAGGGLEYGLGPRASLKVEYQYIDLGEIDAVAPVTLLVGGAPTGETARLGSIDIKFHTVRVGLNYKFDWPTPVVARY
jgi:outer membrane immunogenic protein